MKYFIYARKSTDDEERQILSIQAQLDELRMLATKEGLQVVHEYVEAQTAKEPGRPVFNEMLAAMEKGEAQGILAWHPDRLARNSVDGGRIVYALDTGKVSALKFPTFWFENTPQGKFMLSIAFGQSNTMWTIFPRTSGAASAKNCARASIRTCRRRDTATTSKRGPS
jgi:DNA invertase Pin-like site-specific DNA recombinase